MGKKKKKRRKKKKSGGWGEAESSAAAELDPDAGITLEVLDWHHYEGLVQIATDPEVMKNVAAGNVWVRKIAVTRTA